MTIKDRLYQLIDELPEGDLPTAERMLCNLGETTDPVLKALMAAPWDDEPETEEERKAVEEAEEDVKAGRVVSHEEARRQLLGDS